MVAPMSGWTRRDSPTSDVGRGLELFQKPRDVLLVLLDLDGRWSVNGCDWDCVRCVAA